MSAFYLAGAAKVDITPPLFVPYLGYRPRHQPFQGVHDPLYARSCVISDGIETIALVAIDGIGFANSILGDNRHFTDVLRDRIQAATGIRKSRIMIAASHAHSTPETIGFRPLRQVPGAMEWLRALIGQIVSSVQDACQDMRKAVFKTARGRVEGVSHNRRGAEGPLDTEMIVMALQSPEGEGDIVIVHYACHPVIVQVQPLVSADFIGSLTEGVRQALPSVREVLFLQGACADINPLCGDTRQFGDVDRVGKVLSEEAVRLCQAMNGSGYPVDPVRLRTAGSVACLQSRPLPDAQETTRLRREVKAGRLPPAELSAIEEMLCRIAEGDRDFEAEVQAFRIGNAVLAGVPCEPFCEMGLAFKRQAAPLLGVPIGFANGYLGYIAPPEEWDRGGYEVRLGPWSKVGKEAYGLLWKDMAAAAAVLMKLH